MRHSANSEHSVGVREQLRMFAFDPTQEEASLEVEDARRGISKRERLALLLDSDLDFQGQNTTYGSHDLHAFAAKFPPQLPRAFIRGLTEPGDLVLDPMMGSGTPILEASFEGCDVIGLDIDPLALRLSHVKAMSFDAEDLLAFGRKVVSSATDLVSQTDRIDSGLSRRFDRRSKAFIDYWFTPATQRELISLILGIENVPDGPVRRFLELTFSSIIITKSGGVSRAIDLAHSRPHIVEAKTPKNVIEEFAGKLRKNIKSLAQRGSNGSMAAPLRADARHMPLADCVADLVVTSPPYANAIDYMRAHKFSLVWLGKSVSGLADLRAEYIGAERVGTDAYVALPHGPEMIVRELSDLDATKAKILRKYFADMGSVFSEIARVLRRDSIAIVVVGPSVMRGIDVQTHRCLADIARGSGFDVVGVAPRTLDRNKRMMPARFGAKTASIIEQRIHHEYVLGLYKGALNSTAPEV